jgi:hypothetical protein
VGASPARRYVIIFRPISRGVEIVTVVDGARDWESLITGADD